MEFTLEFDDLTLTLPDGREVAGAYLSGRFTFDQYGHITDVELAMHGASKPTYVEVSHVDPDAVCSGLAARLIPLIKRRYASSIAEKIYEAERTRSDDRKAARADAIYEQRY